MMKSFCINRIIGATFLSNLRYYANYKNEEHLFSLRIKYYYKLFIII